MYLRNFCILLREYAFFFLHFSDIRKRELSVSFGELFLLYIFSSISGFWLMLEAIDLYIFLKNTCGFDLESFSMVNLKNSDSEEHIKVFPSDPSVYIFFRAVLLLPVLEEFLFRSLLSPSPTNIKLFCSTFFVFLLKFISSLNTPAVIFFGVIFFVLLNIIHSSVWLRLQDILQKISVYLFASSLLLFVVGHNFNYVKSISEVSWTNFLPIYAIPQLFFGYFSSYATVKKGLFFSVLFHILNNGLLVGLKMF